MPGVVPMNLYSGIPMDEASSMQGFEMLLYGTKDPLYDYKTNKWVASSQGFLDALNFVQTVYNPKDLLGPDRRHRTERPRLVTDSAAAFAEGQAGDRHRRLMGAWHLGVDWRSALAAVAVGHGHGQDADRVRAGPLLRDAVRRLGLLHQPPRAPTRTRPGR